MRARKRSPTDPAPGRALAALTAVALAGLPPSVPELPAAPLPPAAVPQDTTRAAQDTTRARRPDRVPDLEGAAQDSVAADSLRDLGEPFPDPDSLMRALMERPGYRPVIYRGDTLQFYTGDQRIHLNQRAHIERVQENENLYADSVIFDGQTQYIIAFGKSKLINNKGEEVDSEEGPFFYHTESKIGTVVGGRTRWEIWNVEGDFTLEGSDTLWVEGGHFTSCDLPEPHYRFESDKIKLVLGHIVVAWPVRVYFGDVPVFWFPFMAQDIRRGRHSGILTLQFGVNDIVRQSAGYQRHISNVGYYWAISDYMDAQFSVDWWSDTWTRFDGFYRYRWREKFLSGRLGTSYFILPDGGRELSLAWNHSQQFGERANLRASVSFVSSQQFQRENEFNPERLVQQLRSNISYSRRFDWGTLNIGAQRVQPLSNPTESPQATTMTLPSFSLTLSPIVITPSPSPINRSWYHGLTWTGSTNLTRSTSETPGRPGQSNLNGGLTSNLSLGNIRWNSSATYREQVTDTLDVVEDTIVIGDKKRQGDINWRTSLGYQQRLIGSTTLTPAVNFSGQLRRNNQTNLRFISAPTRVSVGAGLNSDIYGFFPGVGPVERIRHKISPVISWSYSPAVTPSQRAREVFGVDDLRENHVITLGLQQTFEAKLKPRNDLQEDSLPGTPQDSLAASPQQEEARKIMLLAIRTSALTYDVVEGKVTTGSISNSITSELLRGLTLRFTHDLFEESETGRRFAPFLTQLNLGFSLGARTFEGLFGGADDVRSGSGIVPQAEEVSDAELESLREDEVPERDERGRGARQPWTLSIDYSLLRTRPTPGQDPPSNRQSVRANFGFQPTENWRLSWRTQYDIEGGQFVDHSLSLRRSLHRWSATFSFMKASNGNFVFTFRVNLDDLQDVKFDYRQETRG
ncbi:MAG: LPS-assembly protein LptD [Gemmatimonadota bacterium]|nr:MAG: LPS-assembly protein LptD [Gemmatimonadota bacterium]